MLLHVASRQPSPPPHPRATRHVARPGACCHVSRSSLWLSGRARAARSGGVVCGGALLGVLSLLGCKDLTGRQALPAGTQDPVYYHTPAGARAMRATALYDMELTIPGYVIRSGLLTDELESNQGGASLGVLVNVFPPKQSLDARLLPDLQTNNQVTDADNVYTALQGERGVLAQALGALAAYDTTPADTATVRVQRGELQALTGYVELLLADLFCSGVPLSTYDFAGDFTYHAGARTVQVYQDALAHEDSALALAGANPQVHNLALVLKGRALLALGQPAQAAQVVAAIPDGFQYNLATQWPSQLTTVGSTGLQATVSNQEGLNGLPYVAGHDPRTPVVNTGVGPYGAVNYFPARYSAAGFVPFPVASAVEARLIQAEATLQGGDAATWLTELNQLRTNGSATVAVPDTLVDTLGYTGCTAVGACDANGFQTSVDYTSLTLVTSSTITVPDPSAATDACRAATPTRNFSCVNPQVNVYADPAHTHPVTAWQAGTGGVGGLPPLPDPGTPTARVSLLFQERAYWLFMTGHRQGDLRRLIRQYGRQQNQVYPTGPYTAAPGTLTYGADVNVPIPAAEYANPLFHGCLDRNP